MEEEFESLQELYQRLVEVTQNELELEDDLLPYKSEIVELILEQINHMNDVLSKTKDQWEQFSLEHHKLEIERFTYLINSYLRKRLFKIEANAPRLIQLLRSDFDRAMTFLSPVEAKYLDRYSESIDKYIKTILEDMPDNMRRFRLVELKQVPKQNYAFVIGTDDGHIIDNDFKIPIDKDVCKILSVRAIVDHLERAEKRCLRLL